MDARPRPKFWLISLALHVVSVALAIAYIPLMAMLYNERFNDTDYNMLADWAMGFGFSVSLTSSKCFSRRGWSNLYDLFADSHTTRCTPRWSSVE